MNQHPDSPAVATANSAAFSEADLNPPPRAENALVVSSRCETALVPEPAAPAPDTPAPDAHGFDPNDYKWVPVLRKPRKDGLTPQRQRDFIRALADCGCVEDAARAVEMSVQSCYRLRNAPGAEGFAAAWDAAIAQAARRLVDLAFDRAIHGSEEPVFDRDGHRVGRRMRQNDRLLMFLLRAYMPDRFRHAHRDVRDPGEALPPAAAPLERALERLEPIPPDQPHLLMPPDELAVALQVADIADGELPHWHRGTGDAAPPVAYPLGIEFERALEAAKREAAGLPPASEKEDDADDDVLA